MASGETIPDGETLFKYVKPDALPAGQNQIPLSLFMDGEMSCDWKKFRENPFTSKHITNGKIYVIVIGVCDEIRNPRNPKNNGLIEPAWKQEILHMPLTIEEDPEYGPNEAHSIIKGKKKTAICEAIKSNSYLIKHPTLN